MTLVIATATQSSQIVVADRNLTDPKSGKVLDYAAYKCLLYDNPRQAYRLGMAFAGLAEINGQKTDHWLISSLPKAMNKSTRIGLAIPAFADFCTSKITFPGYPVHLTFVMVGRFNNVPDKPKLGRWVPFLSIVSNSIGEQGRQLEQPTKVFRAYSARLLRKKQRITVVRGDLRSAGCVIPELHRFYRYMRRDLSVNAKVEVAARYVRCVADRSDGRVGKHVLGLAILKGMQCYGYDIPPDGRRPKRTMPHAVRSDGMAFRNIMITEHRREVKDDDPDCE